MPFLESCTAHTSNVTFKTMKWVTLQNICFPAAAHEQHDHMLTHCAESTRNAFIDTHNVFEVDSL